MGHQHIACGKLPILSDGHFTGKSQIMAFTSQIMTWWYDDDHLYIAQAVPENFAPRGQGYFNTPPGMIGQGVKNKNSLHRWCDKMFIYNKRKDWFIDTLDWTTDILYGSLYTGPL